VPDFAEDLAGRIDDAGRLREVHAALRTLRRGEREVIALCVWSGLDYASAAAALGVPVGTVRSRLARARAKLRKAAGSSAPGEPGVGSGEPGVGSGEPGVGSGEPGVGSGEPGVGSGEPGCGGEQEEGGRENAARLTQEGTR
jgi:RNA polymerase sigma-70 factor (ECF subfamily)